MWPNFHSNKRSGLQLFPSLVSVQLTQLLLKSFYLIGSFPDLRPNYVLLWDFLQTASRPRLHWMKTCFDRESQILVESLDHAEINKSLLVKNWPEAQAKWNVTRPTVSRHRLFVRHRLHTLEPGCSSQVAGIRLSCFPCKQVFSFRGSPSTILCSSLKRGDNNVLDSTSFAITLFPVAFFPLHRLTWAL